MNDHMLRDLGITRSEIESTVRRSRANIGMDYGPVLSNDTRQSYPALPTISSPEATFAPPPQPVDSKLGEADTHAVRTMKAAKYEKASAH